MYLLYRQDGMRYPKYSRRINKSKDKYSVEQTAIQLEVPSDPINGIYQQATTIVPATTDQGMRKVKHLTVSLTSTGASILYWALIFVPEGYTANPISPAGKMYEPNQFVMNCGIIDTDAGPIRIGSKVSRNLNSGDSIALVVGSTNAGGYFRGIVRYAITLQ